jgi:hypothetical protein
MYRIVRGKVPFWPGVLGWLAMLEGQSQTNNKHRGEIESHQPGSAFAAHQKKNMGNTRCPQTGSRPRQCYQGPATILNPTHASPYDFPRSVGHPPLEFGWARVCVLRTRTGTGTSSNTDASTNTGTGTCSQVLALALVPEFVPTLEIKNTSIREQVLAQALVLLLVLAPVPARVQLLVPMSTLELALGLVLIQVRLLVPMPVLVLVLVPALVLVLVCVDVDSRNVTSDGQTECLHSWLDGSNVLELISDVAFMLTPSRPMPIQTKR